MPILESSLFEKIFSYDADEERALGEGLEEVVVQAVDHEREICGSEVVTESVNHPGQDPEDGEIIRAKQHPCNLKAKLGRRTVALSCGNCALPCHVDGAASRLVRNVENVVSK